MRSEDQSQPEGNFILTIERLAKTVMDFDRSDSYVDKSEDQITASQETSAQPSFPEKQNELVQLVEQDADAMNDFGQRLADYYLQWTQKVDCALDTTKPRDKRLAA